MNDYEDEASKLLWKYVEELKRAEGTEAIHFIARTPADPTEVAPLLPIAESLCAVQRAEETVLNGAARARLLETIRSEPASKPVAPVTVATRRRSPLAFLAQRQWAATTLLLLILSLASVIAWIAAEVFAPRLRPDPLPAAHGKPGRFLPVTQSCFTCHKTIPSGPMPTASPTGKPPGKNPRSSIEGR